MAHGGGVGRVGRTSHSQRAAPALNLLSRMSDSSAAMTRLYHGAAIGGLWEGELTW